MNKLLLLILVFALLMGTASAQESAWWNMSWSYRIDNTITDGVRPYQMSINISNSTGTNNVTHVFCNGNCNVNFTDIRFTLDNTTSLPYWIEDNATGKTWVNVTANGTVNMYYGNPEATSTSNVNITFIRVISGVAGAWDLNGDALDRSGNANHGTLYGGMGYTTGRFAETQAANCTGGDDYIDAGNGNSLKLTGNVSVGIRFKSTTTKVNYGIIAKWNNVNENGYIMNSYPDPAHVNYGMNGGATDSGITTSHVNDGTWKYLVGTYGLSVSKIYVNGTKENEGADNNPGDVDTPLYICRYINNAYTVDAIVGEARVYNITLSQNEITDLSNNFGYVTTNYPGKELVRNYVSSEPQWAIWNEAVQDTTFNQIIYNVGWQTIFINSTQSMTSIRSVMNSSNILWITRWNATTQKWESYKAGWSYRATNNASAGEAVYLKVTNNDTVTRNNGGGNYNWTVSSGWNLLGLDYNRTRTLSQVNASINSLGTCDADEIIYLNPETQAQYTYTCELTNNETVSINRGEGFWVNSTQSFDRVRNW